MSSKQTQSLNVDERKLKSIQQPAPGYILACNFDDLKRFAQVEGCNFRVLMGDPFPSFKGPQERMLVRQTL